MSNKSNTDIDATPISFGYSESQLAKQQKEDNINIFNKQYEYLRQMLFDDASKTAAVDRDGFPILNCTNDNMWFASNVIFIFAKGAVFDEDDERVFERILALFKNEVHGQAFLINKFFIEEYSTSTVLQAIEKQMRVSPGNYHVAMFPIVINDADVSVAPEAQFKTIGVVDKFMQWSTIEPYLSAMVSRYGLYTSPINQPPSELHPTVTETFNFDQDYDVNAVNAAIDINLKRAATDTQRAAFNYGGRDGVITSSSVHMLNKRNKGNTNLFTRIHANEDTGEAVPTSIKGVISQYDVDYTANRERNKDTSYVEYKLYDNDNSYKNGFNSVTHGLYVEDMPTFNFHASGRVNGRRKK